MDCSYSEPITKQCSKCRLVKPASEYYRHSGMKHGIHPSCKECHRKWNQDNADRLRESKRDTHLRRTFGLNAAEYGSMLAHQSGVCAICGGPPRNGKSLAVDHDHRTGMIRGLLCISCNAALGSCKDSENVISKMIEYLER